MSKHQTIYEEHAQEYDKLIAREDHAGNIRETLLALHPIKDATIVDLGAGTGRLARIVAPLAAQVHLLDASAAMLEVAAQKLQEAGLSNWSTQVALHHALPLEAQSADVVMIGWSLGYAVSWEPEHWQTRIQESLLEIDRILQPGGLCIIFETQGTGVQTPSPPPYLLPYFAMLEEQGFSSKLIRTDYRFASLQEAEQLVRFFFGEALAQKVLANQWQTLPEYTGVWWRRKQEKGSTHA